MAYPATAGTAGSTYVPTISSCAFTLDVQWIIDIIDRVQSMIEKVKNVAISVLEKVERVLDKLSGILSWFCWIGPVKWAKKVVKAACATVRNAIRVMERIYNRVLEAMKHVLAPWEVRSAGEQIRDDLAPKCAEFAETLHAGNLKSAGRSWTGPTAEQVTAKLEMQYTHAKEVADGAKAFGTAVQKIGADGVTTTVTFVTSLVTAVAGIITAALEMAAVPVGTAIGAAQVIGLVGAVFTYIMVYVKAMMAIIQQVSEMNNAASTASGAPWPKGAF